MANHKSMMKRSLLFLSILAISPALAQQKSVIGGTVKQDQDLTVVRGQLEDLRAQITAVEREIVRRQNCQKQMKVSTPTGCQDVPGLAAAMLGTSAVLGH
jgi:hypothetical protein